MDDLRHVDAIGTHTDKKHKASPVGPRRLPQALNVAAIHLVCADRDPLVTSLAIQTSIFYGIMEKNDNCAKDIMPFYPSGNQYEISFEDQSATVVEVGGGVRQYKVGTRDVLDPYPINAICDGAHGTVLVPWPNRLEDGSYRFNGEQFQLDITEPSKNNAIHGFLRWWPWQLRNQSHSVVTMGARIYPRSGYPFALDIEVSYELGRSGLVVTTKASNIGDKTLPYGTGQHPYLSPGSGLIDQCTLTLQAGTRILTENDRQLPSGSEPVQGTKYDFSMGKKLGSITLDYPFRDLTRDSNGKAWIKLLGTDNLSANLWVDENYKLIEVYTGDTLSPARRRRGLGAEPMTCPPNALRSGEDLITIEPGDTFICQWGASLR